jgi:hypothetical protein
MINKKMFLRNFMNCLNKEKNQWLKWTQPVIIVLNTIVIRFVKGSEKEKKGGKGGQYFIFKNANTLFHFVMNNEHISNTLWLITRARVVPLNYHVLR